VPKAILELPEKLEPLAKQQIQDPPDLLALQVELVAQDKPEPPVKRPILDPPDLLALQVELVAQDKPEPPVKRPILDPPAAPERLELLELLGQPG
jgi:hypothetical protein